MGLGISKSWWATMALGALIPTMGPISETIRGAGWDDGRWLWMQQAAQVASVLFALLRLLLGVQAVRIGVVAVGEPLKTAIADATEGIWRMILCTGTLVIAAMGFLGAGWIYWDIVTADTLTPGLAVLSTIEILTLLGLLVLNVVAEPAIITDVPILALFSAMQASRVLHPWTSLDVLLGTPGVYVDVGLLWLAAFSLRFSLPLAPYAQLKDSPPQGNPASVFQDALFASVFSTITLYLFSGLHITAWLLWNPMTPMVAGLQYALSVSAYLLYIHRQLLWFHQGSSSQS